MDICGLCGQWKTAIWSRQTRMMQGVKAGKWETASRCMSHTGKVRGCQVAQQPIFNHDVSNAVQIRMGSRLRTGLHRTWTNGTQQAMAHWCTEVLRGWWNNPPKYTWNIMAHHGTIATWSFWKNEAPRGFTIGLFRREAPPDHFEGRSSDCG